MAKSTRRDFAIRCGGVAAGLSFAHAFEPDDATAAEDQLAISMDINGLNAIVHDTATGRAEVILVDPAAAGMGLPAHTPVLVANLRDITNPPADSRPTSVIAVPSPTGAGVEQLGLWDLTDRQVLIRLPNGAEYARALTLSRSESAEAPLELPRDVDDPEAWRDLRYVAEMARICGQGLIDGGLSSLEAAPGSIERAQVPPIVRGRIRFAGGTLEGAIPSQELSRNVVYGFAQPGREDYSQPLTDTVRWRLALDPASIGNYLAVDLVPLRGDRNDTRTLIVSAKGRSCRLSVSNLPTATGAHAPSRHAMSDDEMSALHFGVFYKLLRERPASTPLPVPIKAARRIGVAGIRPAHCPPALFYLFSLFSRR